MTNNKIYIVDDHNLIIEGLIGILTNNENIEVIGFANDGKTCLKFIEDNKVNVVILDINLPDINGIDLCCQILKIDPKIKIIALSTYSQAKYILKMLENGASAYLLKNAESHEINKAIEQVLIGKQYLSFEATEILSKNALQQDKNILTKRELVVLKLIASGLTNIQIAQQLFLSIDTIDSHRKNMHSKLGVKNTATLIKLAIEMEII